MTNFQPPIIIQARQSSNRLPGKVMLPFCREMTMIEFQYNRLKSNFSKVLIATSTEKSDDSMCNYFDKLNINYYRGSINNVMSRLFEAFNQIKEENDTHFVRVGADDPLVSIEGIQRIITYIKKEKINKKIGMYYTSYDEGMIYGCATELFNVDIFKKVIEKVKIMKDEIGLKKTYQEHTKPAFKSREFMQKLEFEIQRINIPQKMKVPKLYLSVDYAEDFLLTAYIANYLINKYGLGYTHENLLDSIKLIPHLIDINQKLHQGFGE